MSDRVQPGVKLDAALWEEFRNDIKERHGGVRGHLRSEVENALRQYIRTDGVDTYEQVDQRLCRIEAAVGASPTDGGTDTFDGREHTHTRLPTPDEKPPSNTATEKKLGWLAKCVRDEHGGDFQEVPRPVLVRIVKDEYGFRSDTAKRYVEQLIDHFDLVDHPQNDTVLVTEDRHAKLVEQRREQLHDEADEKL